MYIPTPPVVRDCPLIEDILAPHRADLGWWYEGVRNHAYRMLNYGRCLARPEPHRDERLAIVAAFHDLPAFLDFQLEGYLKRAADLAERYLETVGHLEWSSEIRLMIENHHKIRPYRASDGALVEATRQADWIDASCGSLRFGLPRSYVRNVDAAFPFSAFYRRALRMVLRYAVSHPLRPLPMLRW